MYIKKETGNTVKNTKKIYNNFPRRTESERGTSNISREK